MCEHFGGPLMRPAERRPGAGAAAFSAPRAAQAPAQSDSWAPDDTPRAARASTPRLWSAGGALVAGDKVAHSSNLPRPPRQVFCQRLGCDLSSGEAVRRVAGCAFALATEALSDLAVLQFPPSLTAAAVLVAARRAQARPAAASARRPTAAPCDIHPIRAWESWCHTVYPS